jgi:plasmid stabilization system protein ParE
VVEINWTREAQLWLSDIYTYSALEDRDAAARIVSGIFQKAQLLTAIPNSVTSTKPKSLAKCEYFFTVITA